MVNIISIKEMQIKTTIRYHCTPTTTVYNQIDNNKCWQECGETETLIHCWWKCKMLQLLGRIVWLTIQFKRLNRVTIWFNNFNTFSCIPKRNENIGPHKNWYTDICSSSFLNSQNVETTQMCIWWTDKIWYILYSEIKRNQLLIHATTWMNLETIMPSERSLSQNTTYFMKCPQEANL